MAYTRTKSRIALIVAAVFLIAAGVLSYAYFSMTDKANPAPTPGVDQTETLNAENPFPKVDWDYWQDVNPDVVGWITVPGTDIDYPILQAHSDNPDYYLHHDIYGDWSVYGVPYLDADNENTGGLTNSLNAVVFGHHMNDGSMFAAFADYSGKKFAREHQEILIQTPDEQIIYKARCVEIVNGASLAKRINFTDETDYTTWYQEQIKDAVVCLDDETSPENLITFCTCSYNYSSNERTLVLASEDEIFWQSDAAKEAAQKELETKLLRDSSNNQTTQTTLNY